MPDILVTVAGGAVKRLADQGDGTHAEVVYAAGAGGGGGGGDASAANQATQIAAEQATAAALGTTADAAPADTTTAGSVPAWLRWIARALGSPSDAAASSGSLSAMLRALLARWPSALSAGRLPVETAPASGVVTTIKPQTVVQDVTSIALLAAGSTATGAVIDLGVNRGTALVTVMKAVGTNQGDTVIMEQSDEQITWYQTPRADGSVGNSLGSSSAASANCVAIGRPSMQYVRGKIICLGGGSAQPAGAVLITAVHPGI